MPQDLCCCSRLCQVSKCFWCCYARGKALAESTGIGAGELFAQLCEGFHPDGLFWSEHSYHAPETPYFSFYYLLVGSFSA